MKFFIFLLVILTWQNDVRAKQQSSLTGFNLISNIISNGRAIQENFIGSYLNFKQTIPSVDLDVTLNANASNCSQDFRTLMQDLNSKKTWALKTMDAWGKMPSGVMKGNIFWLGSPGECEHHLRGLNNSVVEQPYRTRTCVIDHSFTNVVRIVYGICVPESCTENDIVNYVNKHIIQIPLIEKYLEIRNDSVQCNDQRSYDGKAILTIVFLCIIALLILIATALHIKQVHKHNVTIAVPTTTENEAQQENSIDEHDESSPLINRPQRTVVSASRGLINYGSLLNSYYVLKRENQPKTLSYLNGIRVLSLWWVILGHTLLFAAYYSDNVMTIFNWSRLLWFQIYVQAVFSIDSFFVLSGLLTAFIFFVSKSENERFSIVKFLFSHYVYRYLRYTFFYAIMLMIYITISPYLAQGGPIYPKLGTETSTCRQTWWHNLLYINNFFDLSNNCMPVTWFMAVNMQFHWIAPLFLLATSWKWFLGMIVMIIFVLIDIITTAVIVSKNNYDHGILSDLYNFNQTNSSHNYMNDVYVKPWCRIGPYAIGLLLGYILHELYVRSNTVSWNAVLPQRRSMRSHRIKYLVAWMFALFIMALCIFGTYGDFNGHPLTRSGRITFLCLSRLGWAIALSIIIICCFNHQGGIVNRLLGHSIFESLSKLTYGAYLWHTLVIFVNYFTRDQPAHYTTNNILYNFMVHILLSYGLSLVTFLLIEMPIIQLLKSIFKRPTVQH